MATWSLGEDRRTQVVTALRIAGGLCRRNTLHADGARAAGAVQGERVPEQPRQPALLSRLPVGVHIGPGLRPEPQGQC